MLSKTLKVKNKYEKKKDNMANRSVVTINITLQLLHL